MKKITESNLMSAFAGESQARMRYILFSERAEREGFANVSRLFEAIAYAEKVHARRGFENLSHLEGGFSTVSMAGFGPGSTEKNLSIALEGEAFEVEEMYPAYISVAEKQGWAYEAEKVHIEMFRNAAESVRSGQDPEIPDIWVCEGCGSTVEDEAPEVCPICGAKRDRFRGFKA